MKDKKIIYIDYASAGNSGLYLSKILSAYDGPISVEAYAHSEYPSFKSQAIIFRIFDKFSRFIPWRSLKQAWKCLDLYICFAYLLVVLRGKSRNHNLFVFVQFHQSFHAYKWFLKKIRAYCTLVVTVHDAVELAHSYPKIIMSPRDDILRSAHFLLVHTQDSVSKLSYIGKPILRIPFPLMVDDAESYVPSDCSDKSVRFLFIGHIRKEKGIDALVDAWRGLSDSLLAKASLTIAGTNTADVDVDFKGLRNCELIFDYLDDEKFVDLIRSSHYVVMPYRGGTNSGVLSVSTGLGRPCITTRIPLFSESPFFEERLSVQSPGDLGDLLSLIVRNHSRDYKTLVSRVRDRLIPHQKDFGESVRRLYQNVVR